MQVQVQVRGGQVQVQGLLRGSSSNPKNMNPAATAERGGEKEATRGFV